MVTAPRHALACAVPRTRRAPVRPRSRRDPAAGSRWPCIRRGPGRALGVYTRSEEHTSELQSQSNLVCRLLLEKKKKKMKMKTQQNINELESDSNLTSCHRQ